LRWEGLAHPGRSGTLPVVQATSLTPSGEPGRYPDMGFAKILHIFWINPCGRSST
jgi:hypothetical protein